MRNQYIVMTISASGGNSAGTGAKKKGDVPKMRRCRGIKDDGLVCDTILSSYNPDPYLCAACQRRFNRRGEKPRLAT